MLHIDEKINPMRQATTQVVPTVRLVGERSPALRKYREGCETAARSAEYFPYNEVVAKFLRYGANQRQQVRAIGVTASARVAIVAASARVTASLQESSSEPGQSPA